MDNYCELKGLEEVIAEIDNFVDKTGKTTDKILKEAGQMFAKEMKANAPKSSIKHKHLKDSIRVSRVKRDELGAKYVTIGTYLGNGKYRNDVYWGHMVDGGHEIVKNGKSLGYVEGKPFVQPAYEKIKDKAYSFVRDSVYKLL